MVTEERPPGISDRDWMIYRMRNELKHTFSRIGRVCKISGTRVMQIDAKVGRLIREEKNKGGQTPE